MSCAAQVDVIGVNVQDIIHPQDCSEVVRIFQTQGQDSEQGTLVKLVFLRLLPKFVM